MAHKNKPEMKVAGEGLISFEKKLVVSLKPQASSLKHLY